MSCDIVFRVVQSSVVESTMRSAVRCVGALSPSDIFILVRKASMMQQTQQMAR